VTAFDSISSKFTMAAHGTILEWIAVPYAILRRDHQVNHPC
jgi:hypothetical protein